MPFLCHLYDKKQLKKRLEQKLEFPFLGLS